MLLTEFGDSYAESSKVHENAALAEDVVLHNPPKPLRGWVYGPHSWNEQKQHALSEGFGILASTYAAFADPISLVASGRDSSQTVMSLVFHLTAAGPTLTGRGNSPSCINL